MKEYIVNEKIILFDYLCNNLSKKIVKKLLHDKYIYVNNKCITKYDYMLNIGDKIVIKNSNDIDIIYEDKEILVVNKPYGLLTISTDKEKEKTLYRKVSDYVKKKNKNNKIFIINRIDKDTSGLLVVAKNDSAHEFLSSQLKAHSMLRVYSAIVYGNIGENGTVDAPLGRHPTDRKKFAVTEKNSKNAVTHYIIVEKLNGFTLIECRLETGRTHQIRVHMAYIGHPLRGDPVYGPKKVITELHGQALHAGTLGFIHPRNNKYILFSVDPPVEFVNFVKKHRLQ